MMKSRYYLYLAVSILALGVSGVPILPVIVAPSQPQVISLAPEFITPQDGSGKQDSEVAAAKRWVNNYTSEFNPLHFWGMTSIVISRWLNIVWNLGWISSSLACQNPIPRSMIGWITSMALERSTETVASVVSALSCRWKTENENHNVLKTKGYHLEHNFGHGQQHLASLLLTLNLLSFLFHTVLHLVDKSYQQIRLQRGTRKGFCQDILSLTKYLLFDSWQHLIDFMLSDSVFSLTTDSS
jgi:hypothetical protein